MKGYARKITRHNAAPGGWTLGVAVILQTYRFILFFTAFYTV